MISALSLRLHFFMFIFFQDLDSREWGASLRAAASEDNVSAIDETLARHPNSIDERDEEGRSALFISLGYGHFPVVEALLGRGAVVSHADSLGIPFSMAVKNGHLPVVEALLGSGADVNHATSNGATPLLMAAYNGHLAVVEALLGRGADVNHSKCMVSLHCVALRRRDTFPW